MGVGSSRKRPEGGEAARQPVERRGKIRLSRLSICGVFAVAPSLCWAQSVARSVSPALQDVCPRGREGGVVTEPKDLRAKNDVLRVSLKILNSPDEYGHMLYCYVDQQGNEAPTLRVKPEDTLILTLTNEMSESLPAAASSQKRMKNAGRKHDPCTGGPMSSVSTNLHFHGLAVPPVCHQDETLKTLIEPGDGAFEYRIQIPKSQPPGLYWYHPHVHGFSEKQVLGGASGALIVEGIEHAVPRVAGLPERVLVIRDENMPDTSATDRPDPNKPTKQLSINYTPVPYPNYPLPVIKMKPLERQFWRVLNASADTYLDLGIEFDGKRQDFDLVALDGVPLHYGEPDAETHASRQTHIFLPPAGRAEFVISGPPPGVSGRLLTYHVYRGAEDDDGKPMVSGSNSPSGLRVGQDDVDSARPLASIIISADANCPTVQPIPASLEHPPLALSGVRPVRKRKLYFSEKLANPIDPKSATLFFITEEGHSPAVFDPTNTEPTITVHHGDVEDWTIQNRSLESHTFHIHQLHFIVVGGREVQSAEPTISTLRDTVNVPAWMGFGPFPSVTIRMDFRDPQIVGTFPFHCHIMQHVDGGMMGTVRLEPAP